MDFHVCEYMCARVCSLFSLSLSDSRALCGRPGKCALAYPTHSRPPPLSLPRAPAAWLVAPSPDGASVAFFSGLLRYGLSFGMCCYSTVPPIIKNIWPTPMHAVVGRANSTREPSEGQAQTCTCRGTYTREEHTHKGEARAIGAEAHRPHTRTHAEASGKTYRSTRGEDHIKVTLARRAHTGRIYILIHDKYSPFPNFTQQLDIIHKTTS